MSAKPPHPLEGTESPSQIEFLWERYKRPLNVLLWLVVLAVAGYYGLKYYRQAQVNAHWTKFSLSLGLEGGYANPDELAECLSDSLGKVELPKLEQYLTETDARQKPFVLLAIGRRAMHARNWDRAEEALKQLETEYPQHALVVPSDYPVQVREQVKQEEKDDTAAQRNKKPELKPVKPGSAVALLREQITAARAFVVPLHFARPEIPPDAKKVKFELSGGYGSFTIALLSAKAPKHCEKFLELATRTEGGPFWVGLAVDEIQRNGSGFARRPKQLHLGFETTKEPERSKWTKTEPSKHQVEFEDGNLSHFPGAVAARPEEKSKSCADRFWISAEDAAQEDGRRTVFGYVIEGLENITRACEASMMNTQEEDAGVGVPSDLIRVTSVTVLQ